MNRKEVFKEIKKGTFFLKDADETLKADEEVVLESVKLIVYILNLPMRN